ncbi:MAG: thiamine-phosphate kinase, partial [Gluconacetobacter diazotrophicus]|nr:thiamine-phosphate kinase [Gluconacetobacter diazotrophicus]
LTGGDDYELLLAVPPEREGELVATANRLDVPVTRIGAFRPGTGVTVLDANGEALAFDRPGWSHF